MAEADDENEYVCSLCGSDEVQHAMWVNPNTDEVFEEFGTWNEDDAVYCAACEKGGDEGVQLIRREVFEARKEV